MHACEEALTTRQGRIKVYFKQMFSKDRFVNIGGHTLWLVNLTHFLVFLLILHLREINDMKRKRKFKRAKNICCIFFSRNFTNYYFCCIKNQYKKGLKGRGRQHEQKKYTEKWTNNEECEYDCCSYFMKNL